MFRAGGGEGAGKKMMKECLERTREASLSLLSPHPFPLFVNLFHKQSSFIFLYLLSPSRFLQFPLKNM